MKKILENGFRQALRRYLGVEGEAFLFDDDWQGLRFVPELGCDAMGADDGWMPGGDIQPAVPH